MGWKKLTKDFKLKENMFFLPRCSFYMDDEYIHQQYWLYGTPVKDIRRRARIANKCGCGHGWRITKLNYNQI